MKGSYFTNLEKKLENPPALNIIDSVCAWSDLLGFGKQFYESDWNPSRKEWKRIHDRLLDAHTIAIRQSSTQENILILNDGIAKVTTLRQNNETYTLRNMETGETTVGYFPSPLLQLSMFFRGVLLTHQQIKLKESEKRLPGARTVVAFGKSATYISDDIRYDDYVMNYSKPDPDGMSSVAERLGNPQIIYNPAALQMNTAFSKAYIIESAGSRIGVSGANLFVDQSLIDEIFRLAGVSGQGMIWEENEDHIEFLVPKIGIETGKEREDVVIGFRFDSPLKPVLGDGGFPWATKIYRVQRFYPWDEMTTDFYFDLDSPQGWGPEE